MTTYMSIMTGSQNELGDPEVAIQDAFYAYSRGVELLGKQVSCNPAVAGMIEHFNRTDGEDWIRHARELAQVVLTVDPAVL